MANQIVCPHCKSSINVTDRFCPHCGKKLEQAPEVPKELKTIVCSTCGRINSSSNAFCEGCGSELAQKEQIRKEESRQSAKQGTSKKQRAKKTSPSTYILVGFVALVGILIVLEFRNSPATHSHGAEVSVPSPEKENDALLLNEIESLENSVKSNPKNSEAMLHLANMLHDAKFFPRAIEAYKNYCKLEPKDADARVDLGICYFELGESEQAIKEIETALKIEPKHQMAMFNMGIIQLSSGNLPESQKWFKKCVDIDPASTAGKRAQELLQQHSQ